MKKSIAPSASGMHYEQKLMIAAVFIMLVTSLLFVSREMRAQQQAATVSARVEATPYNTRVRKPSLLDSLTAYQKITIGSVGLLALTGGTAMYLLFGSRKKKYPV
ncbi:MAG: hypothetical protein AAB400_02885 [Patescibacteria group bacterium]